MISVPGLSECAGLGVIGTNQTAAQRRGLHLHSTVGVTEGGLPLEVPRIQCWAPQQRSDEEQRAASKISIEEKKTYCWLQGLQDCTAMAT